LGFFIAAQVHTDGGAFDYLVVFPRPGRITQGVDRHQVSHIQFQRRALGFRQPLPHFVEQAPVNEICFVLEFTETSHPFVYGHQQHVNPI